MCTIDSLPSLCSSPYCVRVAPWKDLEPEHALRIATYNLLNGLDLRSGRVDLDAVCQLIAALDVDVVALQEVDRGLERTGGIDQVVKLAELLGWHGVFGPALLGDPDTQWSVCPTEDRAEPGTTPGTPAGPPTGSGCCVVCP